MLLQTATTFAFSHNGELVPVRILLDSGSQRSYLTEQLKKKLCLKALRTESLKLNTFGSDQISKQRCQEVHLKLKGNLGICSPLSMELDVEAYPHLQELKLADPTLVQDAPTETLTF